MSHARHKLKALCNKFNQIIQLILCHKVGSIELLEFLWQSMKVRQHLRHWDLVRLILHNQPTNWDQDLECYLQVLEKIVAAESLIDPSAFSLLSRQTFHKLSDRKNCMQMTLGNHEGLAHLLNGAPLSQHWTNKALGFHCLLQFL